MTDQSSPPNENPAPAPAPAESEETPAIDLFRGVMLLAFSVFLWWYFTDFENSMETSRRMNAILAALYNAGGKWLPVGVVAAIGLWQTASGALAMARQKRAG